MSHHDSNGHRDAGGKLDLHQIGGGHAGAHGHNTEPLGLSDVVLAGVVFYLLTLAIYQLCLVAVPNLLTPKILLQMQLSGALFLLTWVLLGPTVFKPFFDRAEEREARTSGDEAQALVNLRRKRELDEECELGIREARLRGLEERDRQILFAKKRAQTLVEEAQRIAAGEVQAAQQEILVLQQRAADEVAEEGQKLAGIVVERALRAGGSPTIH